MNFDSIEATLSKGPQTAISTKYNVYGVAIRIIEDYIVLWDKQTESKIKGVKFEEMTRIFNKINNRKKGGRKDAKNDGTGAIKIHIDRFQCPKIFNMSKRFA